MANRRVVPESRTCPVDGTVFEVGGRGRRPRKAIYCSMACLNRHRQNLNPHTGSHAPRPRKNLKTLHNESWLRARYLDESLSANDIARMLGCTQPSVLWALRKFGIPVRDPSASKLGRPQPSRQGPNHHPDLATAARQHKRSQRTGLTAPEYDAMLAAQGGLCAICGLPERAINPRGAAPTLAVDHDHATGQRRELLCRGCNIALGLVLESTDTLRSMIAYLERHR